MNSEYYFIETHSKWIYVTFIAWNKVLKFQFLGRHIRNGSSSCCWLNILLLKLWNSKITELIVLPFLQYIRRLDILMNDPGFKKKNEPIGSLKKQIINLFFSKRNSQLLVFKISQCSRFTVLLKDVKIVLRL